MRSRMQPQPDCLAAQKRSAHNDFPPAKRAKTHPSAPIPPTANSTSLNQVDARLRQAETWLDRSNQAPVASKHVPFVHYDVPVKSDIPSHGSNESMRDIHPGIGPTAPTPALLAQINSSTRYDHEQGSDDFRSVIDDLTIQNKKLKRKLRKYERLHCSHLQKEKLFEVKIHGLPAHKKRELENTLRSFASSINNESQTGRKVPGFERSTTAASSALHKTASSSTSDSKLLDSAYASMSGFQSAQPNLGLRNLPTSRQNNVKSYLNDIPETWKPSNMLDMSIKTRSRLVVRRLEQLFTGRGAASHRHTQSQQQQEVSTAAAEHDRSKIEACGQRVWKEGTREAHILPDNTDLRVDTLAECISGNKTSRDSTESLASHTRSSEISRSGSPEQRPTRPLDLDIHRAQVPSDNIDYIRHLGQASAVGSKDMNSDGDDEWVYLNLLMSMAQLHTLNVTPEFIRKAIQSLSQKFELSQDGTKVRWLGGTQGSHLSSKDDEDLGQWKSAEGSITNSKRKSFDDGSSKDELNTGEAGPGAIADSNRPLVGTRRRLIQMDSSDSLERFHYRPLFLHPSPSDDDDSGFNSDAPASTNSMDYETGINSSSHAIHDPQVRLRGRNQDSGPIIFYNRAKFCTDLGGDPNCSNEDVSYNRFTLRPMGCVSLGSENEEDIEDDYQRSALVPMDFGGPVPLTRSLLDLDDLKTSISDCTSHDAGSSPFDMEVSGLGGIQPSDNFVVKVQTRHNRRRSRKQSLSSSISRKAIPKRVPHSMPPSALEAFHSHPRSTPRTTYNTNPEILSAVKTTLPPSNLPPPSYAIQACSSSSSSDAEASSIESTHNTKPSYHNFVTHDNNIHPSMQHRNAGPYHCISLGSSDDKEAKESSYADSDSDHDDDSDDGSIDLLAHARLQDPEAVRAKEAEWEGDAEGDELSNANVGDEKMSFAATGGASEDGSESASESGADSMSVDGEDEENE